MIRIEYLEGLIRARQIAEDTGKGKTAALAITEEINRITFENIVERTISRNSGSEAELARLHAYDVFNRNMENLGAIRENRVTEIWGRPGEITIVDHPEDGIYRILKKWWKKMPFLKWLSR